MHVHVHWFECLLVLRWVLSSSSPPRALCWSWARRDGRGLICFFLLLFCFILILWLASLQQVIHPRKYFRPLGWNHLQESDRVWVRESERERERNNKGKHTWRPFRSRRRILIDYYYKRASIGSREGQWRCFLSEYLKVRDPAEEKEEEEEEKEEEAVLGWNGDLLKIAIFFLSKRGTGFYEIGQ